MARFRNNPETSCWAIAHLHSAELVDWAQRTVPIKNTLTPTDCSARHLSLGGLRPRASAEAATAVLVNEFDAGFKSQFIEFSFVPQLWPRQSG